MLLALVFVYQIAATVASPVSQYPFFYLLNAGNEELDYTKTERVRVLQPGGSVALRYPAFGFGDTITNVKVIGILSSKNLKAEIVEGGPGSNYVLLALLEDNAVPYDVLVILQTAPNTVNMFENVKVIKNDIGDPCPVELDNNDSAEDTRDEEPLNNKKDTRLNADLTQQNSWSAQTHNLKDTINENDSNYEGTYNEDDDDDDNDFENEVNKNSEDEDDTDDPAYATPDIHRPTPEQFSDDNIIFKTSVPSTQSTPNYDPPTAVDKYNKDIYDDTKINVKNIFEPNDESSHTNYDNVIQQKDNYNKYDQEESNDKYVNDCNEIDQVLSDEEALDKYSEISNKKNFDVDDTSAVEY
ncbi:hypothetical protein O0L34_g11859 [Tuta absoluta]|nr:hypothetical protein O0L34_g11859 [Tuta absoluta]